MTGTVRITLRELEERPGTTQEVAQKSSASEADIILQLRDLNERIRDLLGHEEDAIVATVGGAWRADGVAGLLRLNSAIELEVVPKFLDPSAESWRSDFFVLAVLVQTGQLLVDDDIAAAVDDRGGLATLIARSLIRQCDANARRPIRRYQRTRKTDFSLDGDVDWDTLAMPDADGYSISHLELTRRNSYNATLTAAAQILVPEVADGDTQAQLIQLVRSFTRQGPPPKQLLPLPPRHASWESPYQLARLVVEGLGLNLQGGTFTGPGFVLSTWAAWQSLCDEVVRRALPDRRVVSQKKWTLGQRGRQPVETTPDLSPMAGDRTDFLLDAKYKARLGRKLTITSADLYESLAFLRAASASHMSLLYPSTKNPSELELGEWRRFDSVDVGEVTVEGFEVQIQGLSVRGGFDSLVSGAWRALESRVAIST
jgi:5-methylcytosine-specific restriction enzyme subunit McrC